jgi:hypothetical protein
MSEITLCIVKTYAVLSQDRTGWRKEINLVSWNNRPAKWVAAGSWLSGGRGLFFSQARTSID